MPRLIEAIGRYLAGLVVCYALTGCIAVSEQHASERVSTVDGASWLTSTVQGYGKGRSAVEAKQAAWNDLQSRLKRMGADQYQVIDSDFRHISSSNDSIGYELTAQVRHPIGKVRSAAAPPYGSSTPDSGSEQTPSSDADH